MPTFDFAGATVQTPAGVGSSGVFTQNGVNFVFSDQEPSGFVVIDQGFGYGDGQRAFGLNQNPGDTFTFTIDISGAPSASKLSNLVVSISTGYGFDAGDNLQIQFRDTDSGTTSTASFQSNVSNLGAPYTQVSAPAGTSFNQIVFRLTNGGSGDNPEVSVHAITGDLSCFARGTEIAVPGGVRNVQDLKVGDFVTTGDGETSKVLWVGRQTLNPTLGLPDRLRPVRISAGAFGDALPKRDLVVTGDHALLLDGFLINAAALVNGTTISYETLERMGDAFEVYHVETERHSVIDAEGVLAETFVDYAGRAMFDNASEYVGLYGAERIIPEMDVPRISSQRLVPDTLKEKLDLWDANAESKCA